MSQTATILIPDISGFTEFMTSTELSHGTYAVNLLIDSIVKAVGEEYEVSEIEGDAVLLVQKGEAPSKRQVIDTCVRIFNSFHLMRGWIEQHKVCPCGACVGISNLTLKFVVHHGPVSEIKVGKFVKQSGPEMIVAHRLLKNQIGNDEYLLITQKLLDLTSDSAETWEMDWKASSDEYPSIGKIDYDFALLNKFRSLVPYPAPPDTDYSSDDSAYVENSIPVNFRDAYMVIMNIPGRATWVPGLRKVEQDMPGVFVGSVHRCAYDDYTMVVSPMRMTMNDQQILYAERCTIEEMNISFVQEYIFTRVDDRNTIFGTRILQGDDSTIPEEMLTELNNRIEQMTVVLHDYCAKMESSFFEPAFHKN